MLGFATTAAAETYILANQLSDDPNAWKTLYFSEKQLAYFTHWHVDDPSNSQNGEGMYSVKFDSSKNNYDDLYTGGSVYLGAHSYAAGIGPTLENRDTALEYRGKNGNIDTKGTCYAIDDDWSLTDNYRTMHDYVLKESYVLPSPYSTAAEGSYQYNPDATRVIKEQLYNLNAVTIGFTADTSRPWAEVEKVGEYMSCETWAHYTWKYDMPNHAVTIVGWDDGYKKENFKNKYSDLPESERPAGYSEPEGDGAWLVRNSWGAGTNEFPDKNTGQWGIPAKDENGNDIYLKDSNGNIMYDENGNPIPAGSGYFWLSYYDRSIMEPEVLVFDTTITTSGTWPYDQSILHCDQYDLMPVGGAAHVADNAKSANVFLSEEGEHVVAISYEAAADDAPVTYEIYLLRDGFTSPVDGELVAQGTRTHKYKGFYMAYPEEAPIIVQPGQSYSIVLTQQCADKTYRVNVPSSMGENADLVKLGQLGSYAKSVVNPGESFLFFNGEWQDWSLAIVRTQLIPDIPPEAAKIMGNMDSQYDNFPIKGYAFAAPDDSDDPPDDQGATYAFVTGSGATWEKGSSSGLEFRVKRSFADEETFGRFVNVAIDGKTLDASSYSARAGSLVLTLDKNYLGSLATGEHAIKVEFNDGSASGTFKVKESQSAGGVDGAAKGKAAPGTGDPLWAIVVPLAVVAVVALTIGTAARVRSKSRSA